MGKLRTLWNYIKFGFQWGTDWRSRWLLASMLPRYKLQCALGINDEKVRSVNIRLAKQRVPLHFRAQDIFVLHEILTEDPYCPDWICESQPMRIVDLGSHIGMATIQFKAHFPNSLIHCYEPDPDNFRLLKLNTQSLDGIVLHQEAVGAITGEGIFYVQPRRHSASSLIAPSSVRDAIALRCCVRSLDDILTDIGEADLIKFDIEGAEEEVFAHSRLVHDVKFIVGEIKANEEGIKRFLLLFPFHKAKVKSITSKMHFVYLEKQ